MRSSAGACVVIPETLLGDTAGRYPCKVELRRSCEGASVWQMFTCTSARHTGAMRVVTYAYVQTLRRNV